MKILALDMATKTGWAVIEDGGIKESGVQDFTKGRGESNGLMFLRFRKWLQEIASFGPFSIVAYERAHYRGGAATEVCVGLQTRAQEFAAETGAESAPVATTTLKKFATGRGNADKADMVKAAALILGRPPVDDNEADAVHVGRWAWVQYGVRPLEGSGV